MDIDEKPSSPKPSETVMDNAPAEAETDPMQLDDSVHTPALPSDGPEAPPAALTEAIVDAIKKDDETTQEAVKPSTHIKSEPQTDPYDEPKPVAAQEC